MAGEKLVKTIDDWITVLYTIDPDCDDDDWFRIQAGWKEEGLPYSVLDEWNRRGDKFNQRINDKRFDSFVRSSGKRVTGGTIVEIAKKYGFKFSDLSTGHISARRPSVHCKLEPMPISPAEQLALYMETLYQPGEYVNIVTKCKPKANKPEKADPDGNGTNKLLEEWLAMLAEHPDDISKTIGRYNHQYGAWIRCNPLNNKKTPNGKNPDGSVRYSMTADVNVTAFRNVVVETDHIEDHQQQLDLITSLNIPAAAIVDSGGASVHAICRIDASDKETYDKRVLALYNYLNENGFPIDESNKNPARLTRLPGAERGDHAQFLVKVDPSASWATFERWMNRQKENKEADRKKVDFDLIPFSNIEKKQASWIIEKYLFCGGINFLVGAGGSAKTFLECHILACISTGRPTIFEEDLLESPERDPQNVVILNSEDSAESVLYPRLEAAGADLSRIFTIPMETEEFSLLDFEAIPWEKWCTKYHPAVVCFDPLQFFLPKNTDLNDRVAIRQVLHNVASVAQRYQFAPLLVGHTNKKSVGNIRELFGGTADLTDLGRVVMGAGRLNKSQFFCAVGKQNYTEQPPSILYHIEDGAVQFDCRSDETFEALMAGRIGDIGTNKDKLRRVANAKEYIVALLRQGPLTGKDLAAAVKQEGISDRDKADAMKELRDLKIIEMYFPGNDTGKPGRFTAYRMVRDARIPWEQGPRTRRKRPGESE